MKSIDAEMARKAFLAAAKELEEKKEWINELNVFPVPDGDTGTNMSLTIMAAAREVRELENPTMEQLAKAIASGSLRGARGNSGVILSQLFRGFTKEIKKEEEITTVVLANAFVRATETAYKAVMKPKEGTILTVAKGMADKAVEMVSQTEDIVEFADNVIRHGDYVLSQTPEMLPVLKQAGVVDSGGQGLMEVLKGARNGLLGIEGTPSFSQVGQTAEESGFSHMDEADITFGYCTEFIINLKGHPEEDAEKSLKEYLSSIGDSIVVVCDEDMVKVHVHTDHPGLAFEKALSYGSLSNMKIDNMREEHQERLVKAAQVKEAREMEKARKTEKAVEAEKKAEVPQIPDQPRKAAGFIAVSMGEGLDEIFRGIGADYVIQGGQTMNPSTEDILKAVEGVNADTVFLLPNNKNIILAAEQAKSLCGDKNIVVVPSKTVPQGIAAMINYIPNVSDEDNLNAMTEEMNKVKTAQVTYAVRNSLIDGTEISQGDIIAIGDDGLLASGKDMEETVLAALNRMAGGDSELITVYFGEDIQEEDGERLLQKAAEIFPQCEIELHNGGQPVYYYIISVE